MNCPRCGSELVGYQEIGYIRGTMYQCGSCGFKWVGMGRPQPVVQFERELKSWWEINKVYALHGMVVWTIASMLHFLISVQNSWTAIVSLQSRWLFLILTVLIGGIVFGIALSNAILIGGRWWPRTPAVHIALPLLFAATLGGIQGVLWEHPDFVLSTTGVILRNDAVRVISGTLLGICATPIVIIRSSRVCRKKGLTPDLRSQRDERWRC